MTVYSNMVLKEDIVSPLLPDFVKESYKVTFHYNEHTTGEDGMVIKIQEPITGCIAKVSFKKNLSISSIYGLEDFERQLLHKIDAALDRVKSYSTFQVSKNWCEGRKIFKGLRYV